MFGECLCNSEQVYIIGLVGENSKFQKNGPISSDQQFARSTIKLSNGRLTNMCTIYVHLKLYHNLQAQKYHLSEYRLLQNENNLTPFENILKI